MKKSHYFGISQNHKGGGGHVTGRGIYVNKYGICIYWGGGGERGTSFVLVLHNTMK